MVPVSKRRKVQIIKFPRYFSFLYNHVFPIPSNPKGSTLFSITFLNSQIAPLPQYGRLSCIVALQNICVLRAISPSVVPTLITVADSANNVWHANGNFPFRISTTVLSILCKNFRCLFTSIQENSEKVSYLPFVRFLSNPFLRINDQPVHNLTPKWRQIVNCDWDTDSDLK